MSSFGFNEEYIELSHIHLAVTGKREAPFCPEPLHRKLYCCIQEIKILQRTEIDFLSQYF
jgi:hypothetical protein